MRSVLMVLFIAISMLSISCNKDISTDKIVKNEENLYPFKDDETNLYGYMNADGEIIIDAKYYEADDFLTINFEGETIYNKHASVSYEDGTNEIINTQGESFLKSKDYKVTEILSDEVFEVTYEDGTIGALNLREEPVVENVKDNFLYVSKEYGIIRSVRDSLIESYGPNGDLIVSNVENGEEILNILADNCMKVIIEDDVTGKTQSGLMNFEGEIILDIKYTIEPLTPKIVIGKNIIENDNEIIILKVVDDNSKVALFTSEGIQLTDFLYDAIGNDSTVNKEEYYTKDENIAESEQKKMIYNSMLISYGENDLVPTLKDGKWGYINRFTGEEKIPFIYDYAGNYIKGNALVKKGDDKIIIDEFGNEVNDSLIRYSTKEDVDPVYPIIGTDEEVEINLTVDRLDNTNNYLKIDYKVDGDNFSIRLDENYKYIILDEQGNALYENNDINVLTIDKNMISLKSNIYTMYRSLSGEQLFDGYSLHKLGEDAYMAKNKYENDNREYFYNTSAEKLIEGEFEFGLFNQEHNIIIATKVGGGMVLLNLKENEIVDIEDTENIDLEIYDEDIIKVLYRDGDFRWIDKKGNPINPK